MEFLKNNVAEADNHEQIEKHATYKFSLFIS